MITDKLLDAFKAFEIQNANEIKGGTPYITGTSTGPGGTTLVTFYDPALNGYYTQTWSASRDSGR